jgi:hypothetical protein
MEPVVVKPMEMPDAVVINTNVVVVPVPVAPAKAKPRREPKSKTEKSTGYRYPGIIESVRGVSGIPPKGHKPRRDHKQARKLLPDQTVQS